MPKEDDPEHIYTLHIFIIVTHRALGHNVAKELLIDEPSVPLLFEIEAEQHPHLSLIRLILRIHLGQTHT